MKILQESQEISQARDLREQGTQTQTTRES